MARLIHPFSSARFFAEYWETQTLHVARDNARYYDHLLDMDDIDRVLTTLHLSHPAVTMVNAKKELSSDEYTYPSGLIDAARLYQQYEDGGTIVLNNLEGSLPKLMDLCRSMECECSSRFQCNIYVTPSGGAQGLRTHFDSHDVFALQVSGIKRWVIYDTPIERPFRGQPFSPDLYPTGEKTMEFDLFPGDMVYVPRGVMHDAVTLDGASCHITLGVLPTSWTDLLLEAVARVALTDPELRRSLPVGFARQGFDRSEARRTFAQLMQRVAERAELDGALDHFAEDLVSTRHALVPGQMRQVERLSALGVEDECAPRDNLLYHLATEGERVRVSAYGGTLTMPSHAAKALAYALSTDRYRVGDLPGDLDDQGKLVLVRKLVREGLVQVLRPLG